MPVGRLMGSADVVVKSSVVVYRSMVVHHISWAAARAGLSKHAGRHVDRMDVVVVAV